MTETDQKSAAEHNNNHNSIKSAETAANSVSPRPSHSTAGLSAAATSVSSAMHPLPPHPAMFLPPPAGFGMNPFPTHPYFSGFPFGPQVGNPFPLRFPALSPDEMFGGGGCAAAVPHPPIEDDGIKDDPKVELEGKELW